MNFLWRLLGWHRHEWECDGIRCVLWYRGCDEDDDSFSRAVTRMEGSISDHDRQTPQTTLVTGTLDVVRR